MNILSSVAGLLTGDTLGTIKSVAEKFIGDPNAKKEFDLEMQRILQEKENQVEQTFRQRMTMTQEVISAEMAQGDNFTKRARPSVVYWGMALITVHHIVNMFSKIPSLPDQFWIAWGGVVSVWVVGRSAEKFRGKGKAEDSSLIKAING